ncbi:MAG: tetratricopeptide repeat protein [Bacteroidetes bacterium]|nr:tetratricopeptide repeat protein [Bacteroidota bacterium]
MSKASSSPASDPTGTSKVAPQPPMAGLLNLLRAEGFMVTTDDYVHLLKILELYGNETPESLALRICPIIATTPDEQRRFYPILAQYFRQQAAPAQAPVKKRKALKISVALFAILLTILAAFFWRQKPPFSFPDTTPTLSIPKDSLFVFDLKATGVFSGRQNDTAGLHISWDDSGRGSIGSGYVIRHRFSDTGLHLLRATARGHHIENALFRLAIRVCPGEVKTMISGADVPQPAQHFFSLKAQTLPPALPDKFDWDTSAIAGYGQFRILNDSSIQLRFQAAGIYSIRAIPRSASAAGYCLTGNIVNITVEDTARQFEARYSPGPALVLPQKLKLSVTLAALLGLFAIVLFEFRRWLKKRKQNPAPKEAPQAKQGASELKPPWEVPFPAPVATDILPEKALLRFFQLLRFQTDDEVRVPDLRASIRASIRQAGQEELIFSTRRRIQSFLILIDASQVQGLWVALCGQLVKWMEASGIPVHIFYYDIGLQCSESLSGARISLGQLADIFPDSVPILFGDGRALMHPMGSALLPEILEQLNRWESRMLITPLPRNEWSSRERLLAQHLLLAPADAAALQRLAQDFKSGRKTRWEQIDALLIQAQPKLNSVAALKTYLKQDEALFQWLCALCIYPKPRWELLIAFGKVILPMYQRAEALCYDNLLHFCRIPWLAAGSFPQRLRLDMLKALSPENEIAVRRALSSIFEKVHRLKPGTFLFSDEQELQECLNGFVLYAHAPESNSVLEHHVQKFQSLLLSGEMSDVPARKYLEGGHWETPIQSAGKPLSLQGFLEKDASEKLSKERDEQRRQKRKQYLHRLLSVAGILVIACIWLLLQTSPAARKQTSLSGLYQTDSGVMISLRFAVDADFKACGDSQKLLNVLPATLQTNKGPYGMRFDAGGQNLQARVPLRELVSAPSLMLSITGSSVPLQVPIDPVSASGIILIQCRQGMKTFTVGAADSLPAFLNEIWSGSLNQRLININLVQGMVWYSTGGPDTWGSYRIDTVVSRNNSGSGKQYRIVLRAYPGYALMIIGHADEQGFNLAFCPQRWPSREEALSAGNDCATPDAMQLYYRKDRPQLILLPVTRPDGMNPPLQAQESVKIKNLLGTSQQRLPSLVLLRYTNRRFLNMRDFSNSEWQNLFLSQFSFAGIQRLKQPVSNNPNPFQREAIRLELKATSVTAPDPNPFQQVPGNNKPKVSIQEIPKNQQTQTTKEDPGNESSLPEQRYQKALELLQSGDEKQAVSLLLQNVNESGKGSTWRISSLRRLADYYAQQGNRNQAIRLLEQALKENPDPATAQAIRERLQSWTKSAPSKY